MLITSLAMLILHSARAWLTGCDQFWRFFGCNIFHALSSVWAWPNDPSSQPNASACIRAAWPSPRTGYQTRPQFSLPSSYRTAWFTYGAGVHVSDIQNFDACMQPNMTSSRTEPTTKTTKHDHLYELNPTSLVLHSLAILAQGLPCNQSRPYWTSIQLHLRAISLAFSTHCPTWLLLRPRLKS